MELLATYMHIYLVLSKNMKTYLLNKLIVDMVEKLAQNEKVVEIMS